MPPTANAINRIKYMKIADNIGDREYTELTQSDSVILVTADLDNREVRIFDENDVLTSISLDESIEEQAVAADHELTFAEQVEAVLNHQFGTYSALKVSDTPKILLDVGCEQLPILYTQQHLRDALHEESKDNSRCHGLTVAQIKALPEYISAPAIVMDSLSRNNSIVIISNTTDNKKRPLIATIKPNGKGVYGIEEIGSNFVTSLYGRNGIERFIQRAIVENKILFASKNKTEELFKFQGLQLPEAFNNLPFDSIVHQSRNIVKGFSGKKKEESIDHEPTFAEQVDMVLSGSASRFKDLKVCQTPEILLRVGCEQLPMLYAKSHLHEAIKTKNAHTHAHGLTVEQIKAMPDFLKSPVMVFDSLTRNDSIVVVTPEYDPDHNPVIISVRPNGHGKHDRDDTASNFVTSMYGKDNFVNFLNHTIEQKKLLYAHKEKSQELFRVLGLQSSKGVNNLSFDTIIHQSRNIVKGFSGKKEEESIDHELTFAEQVDMVLAGNANRYNDLKVCDTPDILLQIGCEQLPIILTAFENEYDVRRFTEVKEMIDINREVIFLDVSIDELIGLTEQSKKAGWSSSSLS